MLNNKSARGQIGQSNRAHSKGTNISYFRNNAKVWSRLDDTQVNCFIPGENYLVSKGKASSVQLWESDTFCQVPRSPPRSIRSQQCRRHGGIPAASARFILIRYILDTKGKGGMLNSNVFVTCPRKKLAHQKQQLFRKGKQIIILLVWIDLFQALWTTFKNELHLLIVWLICNLCSFVFTLNSLKEVKKSLEFLNVQLVGQF